MQIRPLIEEFVLTLLHLWGSEAPSEAIWALNDFIVYVNALYKVNISLIEDEFNYDDETLIENLNAVCPVVYPNPKLYGVDEIVLLDSSKTREYEKIIKKYYTDLPIIRFVSDEEMQHNTGKPVCFIKEKNDNLFYEVIKENAIRV